MRPTKDKVFWALFRITRYYAWWVLLLVLALTAVAVYYVREFPIRSSYFDLLPQDDPLIDEYRDSEEYLAQTDYLALLLELLETEDRSYEERKHLLLEAAEAIAAVLRDNPEFLEVVYLLDTSPKIPDQYLLLYTLDATQLARIESSIALARRSIADGSLSLLPTTGDLGEVYRQVGGTIEEALSGGLSSAATADVASTEATLAEMIAFNEAVLGAIDGVETLSDVTDAVSALSEIFTPAEGKVSRAPEGTFSRDRTRLLMTVRPRYPSQRGVAYCSRVMEVLADDLDQVDLDGLGVHVGVTGTYANNTETNAVINADMRRTTIIASVGVLVIFYIAFGSIFYSVIAIIPLLVSLVLTMAWAKFAVGGFNLITSFLPALVLGLGIDYGIHFISRYAEERSKGRSLNRALYTAVLRKGKASFLAAVTTAFVFLGLLSARSRALFEVGAITGVGVLVAFLATIFLLPVLITLAHYLFRFHHRERVTNYAPHLSPFFRFVTEKGRVIFAIVLILTFFVAFQAARISFVFSSADMVPSVPSQDVYNEILTQFGASPTRIGNYFTFFEPSEEELSEVVERLRQNSLVEEVQSPQDLLPVNLSDQQRILNSLNITSYIEQLGLFERSLANRSSVLAQIRNLLTQFGLLQYGAALNGQVEIPLACSELQRQLRTIQSEVRRLDVNAARTRIVDLQVALQNLDQNLLQIRELPPLHALLKDVLQGLPEGIRSSYLTSAGEYVIHARVSEEVYEGENLRKFDEFAASISNKYFGMPLVGKQLEVYMKRDFFISTLLAAALIILILLATLRGGLRALLASTPLVLGYLWMLGGMKLLQIDFNFINITISPLLIGIGVDNGIHILHRYTEEREINSEGAIERSGKMTAVAVIVTSLTTMLVFGSLLLARTPGLQLLGASAILGIGFTLVFSLLFLPAALRVVERGKRV